MDQAETNLTEVLSRLEKIEESLQILIKQKTVKEWYTTAEGAEVLKRAEWTVREWCRTGRVKASKRPCGRGKSQEWIISHEELQRIKNEGLLPDPRIIQKPK
jgi:Helix-turn-helix domain